MQPVQIEPKSKNYYDQRAEAENMQANYSERITPKNKSIGILVIFIQGKKVKQIYK